MLKSHKKRHLTACCLLAAVMLALSVTSCGRSCSQKDHGDNPDRPASLKSAPFPDAILLDKKGYRINGEYRLLRGGTIQWSRLPEEVWEDRLLKFKAAGFNTVDMYITWSEHEPEEGKFDFETKNVRKFLELCKKYGLYVYVRPGPYICNEYTGGGVPSWLLTRTTKRTIGADGLVNMRTQDKEWLDASRKYFEKLNAVLAPYQITRGGPIILYAVENEYDHFPLFFLQEKISVLKGQPEREMGSSIDFTAYFTALRDIARNTGIEIPITTAPGTASVKATGDVPGIVPMPNIYNFFEPVPLSLEKTAYDILEDMHNPQHHRGAYANYPSGITETSRLTSWMKRSFFGGMDAFFAFNIMGFYQDGYKNSAVPSSEYFKYFEFKADRLVQGFLSPVISFLPGVLDYYGAIGPSGTLREKFFSFRRANMFFDAFESLIAPIQTPKRSNAAGVGPLMDKRVSLQNGELGSLEDGGARTTWWLEAANGTYFISLVNDALHDVIVEKGQLKIDGQAFPRFSDFTVPVEEFPGMKSFSTEKLGFNGSSVSEQANASLLVAKLPLTPTTKLKYSTSEVLTVKDFNNEKLVVLFGKEGTTGELALEGGSLTVESVPSNVTIREKISTGLTVTYTHTPGSILALKTADGKKIKVLITERHQAGRIWFAKRGTEDILFAGPNLVVERGSQDFDFQMAPGGLKMFTISQTPFGVSGFSQFSAFDNPTGMAWFEHSAVSHPGVQTHALMQGRIALDDSEKEPDFPTNGWEKWTGEPRSLEHFGISGGHAWYRAEVDVPHNVNLSKASLYIENASDMVSIYINGAYAGTVVPMGTEIDTDSGAASYKLPGIADLIRHGKNTLAFHVEVWGHGSFMFPKGKIPVTTAKIPALGFDSLKGLQGSAKLAGIPITNWQIARGVGGERNGWANPQWNDSNWQPSSGSFALPKGGIVWYRTNLSKGSVFDPLHWATQLGINIKGKSAKGTVFLNGKVLGRWLSDNDWLGQGSWTRGIRNGWAGANDLDAFPLEGAVLKEQNVLAIALQDTSPLEGPSGFIESITLDVNHEDFANNGTSSLAPVLSEFAQVHLNP